jgi:hypothetical protein
MRGWCLLWLLAAGCSCKSGASTDGGLAAFDAGTLDFDLSEGPVIEPPTGTTPTPVKYGTTSKVIQMAAGEGHFCSVHEDGTVFCWGENTFGQLGDGTFQHRYRPVQVVGVEGAVQVDASLGQSCARLGNGTVKCWGTNALPKLGVGTARPLPTATAVAGISDAVKVIVGERSSCAIRADRSLWCWKPGEAPAATLQDVVDYDLDVTGCAAFGDAGVTCGTQAVSLPARAVEVFVTHDAWCFRLETEVIRCTGNTVRTGHELAFVENWGSYAGVKSFALGFAGPCGVLADGSARCHHGNTVLYQTTRCAPPDGQWPSGTVNLTTPVLAAGAIAEIDSSWGDVCFRLQAGGVECFGDNSYGEVGDGTNVPRCRPAKSTDLR